MGNNSGKCDSDTSSTTSSRFVTARHTWKIRDFAWIMDLAKEKKESQLSSGVFDVKTDVGDKKFVLFLTWNNDKTRSDEERRFVGAYLQQVVKDQESPVTAKFSITITSQKVGLFGKKTWSHSSGVKDLCRQGGYGRLRLISKKRILDYALDKEGALTIVCGIEIMTKPPAAVVEGASEEGEEILTKVMTAGKKQETGKDSLKPVEKVMLPDEEPTKPGPKTKPSADNLYNVN